MTRNGSKDDSLTFDGAHSIDGRHLRNDWNGLGQNLVYLHGYFSIFASVALGLRNWQFLSKVNAVGLQLLLDVSWSPNFNV